jgi:hypothetical protein
MREIELFHSHLREPRVNDDPRGPDCIICDLTCYDEDDEDSLLKEIEMVDS